MKFLDLHSHPVFKTLFNKYTPWDAIPANDHLIGDIIESQSNLRQLIHNGECNLICMSLHPPEKGMLDQWLWKLAPLFTNALDQGIMDAMVKGLFYYQKVLEQELNNLYRTIKALEGEKEILVLKDFKDYKPHDTERLYVIFNIEGGHTFYNAGNETGDVPKIIADFKQFITRTDLLVLYVTPTHLTPNIFITHAYGNKILGKGKLLPREIGITDHGKLFLDEIAKSKVLVDVKHMSVVARQQFYTNASWNKKPLLCSHAGVAGISWDDKLNRRVVLDSIKKGPGFFKIRYSKPKGILKGTYFNPCSINLYNEDIGKILSSGGLIGISFDLRIIGGDLTITGSLKTNEKEFVSPEEFEVWKDVQKEFLPLDASDFDAPYEELLIQDGVPDSLWDEEDLTDEWEELNGLLKNDMLLLQAKSIPVNGIKQIHSYARDRKVEHTRFFINQIFHIVKVTEAGGLKKDPWKHVCMGTDFDGFIRAIDSCKNITQLDEFAGHVINMLPGLADEAGITLPRSAKDLVYDIFYDNAYQFIKTHFTASSTDGTQLPQNLSEFGEAKE